MTKTLLCSLFLIVLGALGCAPIGPSPAPTGAVPAPTTLPTVLASGTAVPATAARSGRLRYFQNANSDVRDVPMLMALDELQAKGYTVEQTSLAQSNLLVDALARGDADVITANTQTMWTAIGKGVKAYTFVARIGSTLILQARPEIKACADLDGKAVGVAASTGANPALLNLYIQQNCPDAKPQLVVIADNTARVAALMAGQIDAALLQSEQLLQLERDAPGKFHTLVPLYKEFSNVQVNALHVRREWAEQNPEIVRDLIRALLTANRRGIAQPQLLYDEAVKRLQLDPATAKQAVDAYLQVGLWDPNGGLTAENVQYTLGFFKKIKAVPDNLKLEDVADLSYLNAVLGEIGRK